METNYDVPYLPSTWDKVALMIQLAEIKPGIRAADLGSGDGRVVVALAKAGASAFGFEIDSDRVELSRQNILEHDCADCAFIIKENYFDANFKSYDLITIYGITSIMQRLEDKLLKELRLGTKVVSNRFAFPNWKPIAEENDVFVYVR
jgi:precorrin-6B methylase 2